MGNDIKLKLVTELEKALKRKRCFTRRKLQSEVLPCGGNSGGGVFLFV